MSICPEGFKIFEKLDEKKDTNSDPGLSRLSNKCYSFARFNFYAKITHNWIFWTCRISEIHILNFKVSMARLWLNTA